MKTEIKKIENYEYSDAFGSIIGPAHVSYIDGNGFLDEIEVAQLSHLTALQFEKQNRIHMRAGNRVFSKEELYHLLVFFKIQSNELALLLNVDKSVISKQLKGLSKSTPAQSALLIEMLWHELQDPGYVERRISALKCGKKEGGRLEAMDIDPVILSKLLIKRFRNANAKLTHLKLQKLLYFCQGLGISLFNVSLIEKEFSAWKHGPVNKEVYHWAKKFRDADLTQSPPDAEGIVGLDERVPKIIEAVFQKYGKLATFALVNETHKPGSPWALTMKDDTGKHALITHKLMQEEFQGMYL